MTEHMSPAPWTLNAGTPQGGPGDVCDRMSGLAPFERSEGSHGAQEDEVAFDSWASHAQVLQQGITNVLRQWQLDLATSLPGDSDRGRLPAEVRQAQSHHIPGAQTEAGQQKKDRSVADARRRRWALRQYLLNFFRGQSLRQSLQGPGSCRCQCLVESRTASTLDREVAQEHTHRRLNDPDGMASIVSIPLRNEVPHSPGRIRVRVVSKEIGEVGHVESIGGNGPLGGSTVISHPLEKFTNQEAGFRW